MSILLLVQIGIDYSKYVEAWNNKHKDNRIDTSKDWFYGNTVEELLGLNLNNKDGIFVDGIMNIFDDSDCESIIEGEIYRLYTSTKQSIHDKYNPYFYQLDTSNEDKNIKVLTPIKYTRTKERCKYAPGTIPSKINIMSKSTAEKQTKLKYILLLRSS